MFINSEGARCRGNGARQGDRMLFALPCTERRVSNTQNDSVRSINYSHTHRKAVLLLLLRYVAEPVEKSMLYTL